MTDTQILDWMTAHKCVVSLGVGDYGQMEFEATPEALNPGFQGFGGSVREAVVHCAEQNGFPAYDEALRHDVLLIRREFKAGRSRKVLNKEFGAELVSKAIGRV
jgi:hypothetical protein